MGRAAARDADHDVAGAELAEPSRDLALEARPRAQPNARRRTRSTMPVDTRRLRPSQAPV
jgi:hypothetical protein